MVIRVLDLVRHCHTWQDGDRVYRAIVPHLDAGGKVTLSFDGVSDVPSSFVNGALLRLVERYGYDFLRAHLAITETNRQISGMIRRLLDKAGRVSAA